MNETMTKEIVRLVREIAEDERHIRDAEMALVTCSSPSAVKMYDVRIKMYKDSLERKQALLTLLTK